MVKHDVENDGHNERSNDVIYGMLFDEHCGQYDGNSDEVADDPAQLIESPAVVNSYHGAH